MVLVSVLAALPSPIFEALGFGLAAGEYQAVQARFVDDAGVTLTTYIKHSPFIII
jgi:hypothetical protein